MLRSTIVTTSLIAIAAFAASPAFAQDSGDTTAADAGQGDEIIVTGTRAEGRSRLDSPAPVDVLGGETLRRQGSTEVGQALATVAPSIDFKRSSAVDGTDAIRPATLRGLSPDQTVVLSNGTRGHTSALLNVNGRVGRGSAAVDLNTIPTVALDRIEVLRDGASAQYGSDAIAGVINLRLREARSGGGVSATYGFYATDFDPARGGRSVTGEPVLTVSGWQGIGFGNDGFLTISGEYVDRKPTNRGGNDPRVTPTRVTSRFGDPETEQATVFANAGVGVGDAFQLYGWVGYQDRDSKSAAFPRLAAAAAAGGVGSIWPDGFLPLINTKSRNLTSAVGLRGDVGEWGVDLNLSYGRNRIAFNTLDSANYSLGNNSPTEFYDGAVTYDQWVAGLDVTRRFDVFESLNLAFGAEWRREGYKIAPGEPASYENGGAQGFPGFAPLNSVKADRRNISAYLDVEAEITPQFLVAVAGRVEDYSDFGSTANGKLSLRYDVTDWFAARHRLDRFPRAVAPAAILYVDHVGRVGWQYPADRPFSVDRSHGCCAWRLAARTGKIDQLLAGRRDPDGWFQPDGRRVSAQAPQPDRIVGEYSRHRRAERSDQRDPRSAEGPGGALLHQRPALDHPRYRHCRQLSCATRRAGDARLHARGELQRCRCDARSHLDRDPGSGPHPVRPQPDRLARARDAR